MTLVLKLTKNILVLFSIRYWEKRDYAYEGSSNKEYPYIWVIPEGSSKALWGKSEFKVDNAPRHYWSLA